MRIPESCVSLDCKVYSSRTLLEAYGEHFDAPFIDATETYCQTVSVALWKSNLSPNIWRKWKSGQVISRSTHGSWAKTSTTYSMATMTTTSSRCMRSSHN